MAKSEAKGIKVGSKLRVSFVKSGISKDNKEWQLFTYTESKKQDNGEYKVINKYTVFVNNPIKDLKDGDYVVVKSITQVNIPTNVVNGVKYINPTLNCDIEIKTANNDNENNEAIDPFKELADNENSNIDDFTISPDDILFN